MTVGLIRYVDDSHIEGLCEATRVLGNLSRTRTVRELLMQFAGWCWDIAIAS